MKTYKPTRHILRKIHNTTQTNNTHTEERDTWTYTTQEYIQRKRHMKTYKPTRHIQRKIHITTHTNKGHTEEEIH